MSLVATIKGIVFRSQQAGTFKEQVEAFVAEARNIAGDGLSVAEASQIFTAFIALAVGAAQRLGNSGPEKKAIVLSTVGYLYDAIAPQLPLPWFLQPFRAWLRPHVRQLVLTLADGAIEAVYQRLADLQPSQT